MLNRNIYTTVTNQNVDALFALPEKVLQFGTGVLLRGLPDYFIDKANKQGLFNGRIVVVKSTDQGNTDAYGAQDGLYTILEKGIEDGLPIERTTINASISRVISAKSQWNEVLICAASKDIQVIISNTTEVGITLVTSDATALFPESFPGKLLHFLLILHQHFFHKLCNIVFLNL
jgi:tagaturonate reductase